MSNPYDALWAEPWQLVQAIGPLTRSRYRLIRRELSPYLFASSTVLDAGCGNGTFLSKLASEHDRSRLFGIEFSEAAINSAPPGVRDRIIHGELDTELAKFAKEPVDIIVCSEVLEHLADPEKTLLALGRALKRGGKAVFTVPAGRRWWSSQDEYAGHVQRFELTEFQGMLLSAGFRIIRIYSWGVTAALAYDRLTSLLGPARAISAGRTRIGALVASVLYNLFRIEDWLPSRHGIQLVAVAERT